MHTAITASIFLGQLTIWHAFAGLFMLGMNVFTGTIFHTLKRTLRSIVDDKSDGFAGGMLMPRFCNEGTMEDNYVDDLEMGGPGLASEKPEGAALSVGTVREGVLTRYNARTFGQKLIVTREAMEDTKYDQALKLARRLKRSLLKTVEIDATNLLVRAFNTAYVGGDGLPLGSASHTLPNGGTFSNIMAVPMSPSRAAMIVATSQMRKFPGHDGITEGVMPKKIVCPVDQWAVWEGLVKSTKAPEAGMFNEINVVNQTLDITDIVANQYWSNTTTNWGIITDADNGLNFLWRRKPSSDDWVEQNQQTYMYSISARWARGWSDPRGFYGVNA